MFRLACILVCLAAVSTLHASDDPSKPVNRLAGESSPYLLQHRHNPVDWYPWGPEAFAAAREQDKPIFLSIGYSTCYWCHVMERESFMDPMTAAQMNADFICVKVDREERPDVDDIYMAAVQALTGRGGWPMSVFLEPEQLRPYFGGTYFPPESRRGRPSFRQVLTQSARVWRDRREHTIEDADRIAARVRKQLGLAGRPVAVGPEDVQRALDTLMGVYDAHHGGFGRSPTKFPLPSNLALLIGAGRDDPLVRKAVLHTLDRMAMGGIHDQIGGGFHRYSTDRQWIVPHFEKMLYDNAQLASIYAHAHAWTGDPYYAEITRGIVEYVLREMRHPEGAFYSAQDAEVDEREGRSYVWTRTEVREALASAERSDLVDFTFKLYGFDRGVNFRDPHHPDDLPRNVLRLGERPEVIAESMSMSMDEFQARRATVDTALLAARDQREQPGTDDKIIAGWNALMISGLVDAAIALDEPRYLDAAMQAARFILDRMRAPDGGLHRTWTSRSGARIDAFLQDYALVIDALLTLHDADGGDRWLRPAIELERIVDTRFRDPLAGGYFDTLADQDDLFVRVKTTRDGVIPCGTSVMIANLRELARITDSRYADAAVEAMQAMSSFIRGNPTRPTLTTLALHEMGPVAAPANAAPVAPPPAPTPAPAGAPDPVTIACTPERVMLEPGTTVDLEVAITVGPGFHINAHEPGLAALTGLELRLVSGADVDLAVDYPAGEPYRDDMRVHRGTVRIPIRLMQTGPGDGERPKIMVVYQVCTDERCLPSSGRILPVLIQTP